MTCEEFLDVLDARIDSDPLPEEARAHAAACPGCALALRMEETLREAPRWAPVSRLEPEHRRNLEKAAQILWRRSRAGAELLQESVLSAAVAVAVLTAVFLGLPSFLERLLPPALTALLAEGLAPLAEVFAPAAAAVRRLLEEGWGLPALLLAAFSLLLGFIFSVKALFPARA